MKTKRQFFSLALAALVLGACSDDLGVNNGQPQGGVGAGETGYVSLAINLPTQPSTRAANDDFDDGDAVEYKVNDATLLIFVGANEQNSIFNGAYALAGTQADYNPEDDNITSKYSYTAPIVRPTTTAGQNIYALAVINGSGILTSETAGNATTWKIGNTTLAAGTTTFAQFNAALTLTKEQIAGMASRSGSGNFLMLNAPLYTAPGGQTQPAATAAARVLSVIDPNNIFDSESMAEDNPAADIYVERAVAKVTVTEDASLDDSGMPTGVTVNDIAGWTLDITNQKTFPVRNVNGASWWSYYNTASTGDHYRFVGTAAVDPGLYRTYWGIDPNYDGTGYTDGTTGNVNASTEFFSVVGTAPTTLTQTGATNPMYCLENTFNTANMMKDQTTRVIVAVKLSVGYAGEGNGDFYVLNNVKSTFYKKADIENVVKQAYLDNAVVQAALHGEGGLTSTGSIGGEDLVVTYKHGTDDADEDLGNLEGGTVTVATVHVSADAADNFENSTIPVALASNNQTVTNDINAAYKISYYKGGVAYYPVMIKHFGDDATPWDTDDASETSSYPVPYSANNWLGRYGVLRNNWYTVNVKSISSIGSADVEPEYGPDDPVESWISVEINILSWAVRTQDVGL